MPSDLIIYNYEGELINVIPNSVPFIVAQQTANIRRLKAVTTITRGSGYTDTEIEQSNTNIESQFIASGTKTSGFNVEYKLNWGKGIADATPSSDAKGISAVTIDNGGVFISSVSQVVISVNAVGYKASQDFAGSVTLANISGGSGTKEITAINVTNPGVYIVNPQVPESERKFEFSISTPGQAQGITTQPQLTPTVENYGGIFPSTVSNVDVSIEAAEGWAENIKATATASLATISGTTGSLKQLNAITITNPGVYIPIPYRSSRSANPVQISIDVEGTVKPTFSQIISNYLSTVDIVNKGGGITNDTPVLTLDVPAAKAGDANIAAATVTFSTETFSTSKITFDAATTFSEINLKIDLDNLRHIIASAGKTSKLSKEPFKGVIRGKNVIVPGDTLGEITRSPILIREEY